MASNPSYHIDVPFFFSRGQCPVRGHSLFKKQILAFRIQVNEQPMEGGRLAQDPAGNLAQLVHLLLGQRQAGLHPLEIEALGLVLQGVEGDLRHVRVPFRPAGRSVSLPCGIYFVLEQLGRNSFTRSARRE